MLWGLFLIRDVIILLFVAVIFMSALSPIVTRLEKLKIPKSVAIALLYVVVISIIALLVSFVVSPLIEQTGNLITNLPKYLNTFIPDNSLIDRSVLQQELGNFSKNAFAFTIAVFDNLLAFISIAVLTFYLLLERENLDRLVGQFFIGNQKRARDLTAKIEYKLGAWMRGQIVLSLMIGTTVYVVLEIINLYFVMPYALPLAILAGLMEVIPVLGPIISAIPAIIIAYTISPVLAGVVAIAYFFIQQLEAHVIIPQLMKKAVGLNPLVVILAVAIGGRLLGISGALLAVPITVVAQIITEDLINAENVEEAEKKIING